MTQIIDPRGLPALSVRQPWAWAIIHAGKPVENRSHFALDKMGFKARGVDRFAIHAAKGMTRDEYEDAATFMEKLGVACPSPASLLRGGIIGTVRFEGIVNKSPSPWFFGPKAIVMSDPVACDFIPATGALGLFTWAEGDPSAVPGPAKWMLAGGPSSDGEVFF